MVLDTPAVDKPEPSLDELLERLTAEGFQNWYKEHQYRENIREGKSYFNKSGSVPNPSQHNPSQLLQCHRKIVYRQENAPAERSDPDGMFWFGSRFEEELIFPFLERAVAEPEAYVQNSIWIDFDIQTDAGDINIKGTTDPVIVDADAIPILPTEIKTKSGLDALETPNSHHRAQLHAYLVGLSNKFDKEITDGVLVYADRKFLDLKTFHVRFDECFWNNTVLEWATRHTKYRLDEELPPADPEFEWECEFCSYKNRCGKGDTTHRHYGPTGLLPRFEEYPREKLIEYLECHPESGLTPTLAEIYPELADEHGVLNWYCDRCDSKISYSRVSDSDNPLCPVCADADRISSLSLITPRHASESDDTPTP